MSVTIKDVAREAAVSVATVSRALNGHDNVTRATREHIGAIAKRLRYVPHAAARSLITRRTETLGVVLPDLYGEFFSELIRGIDVAAREHGLHLLVSSSHGSASETGAALRALSGRVDGILIMSPHAATTHLADDLPVTTPVVLMNTRSQDDHYLSLAIDNHGGAWAMVEHLVGSGYRRIALIGGPTENFDAQERLRGYREALSHFAKDSAAQVLEGNFSEASGHAAGLAIAAMTARPDAVFAANDMMAVGCLRALRDAGLHVPRDIAVAGFDDIPIARFVAPGLTTMRVNIAELGGRAARALIAGLTGPQKAATHEVLAPELVIRASTNPSGASREDSS
ncbi:MAG: LacI family DNA-binding transcriptional regulator [Dokdonella sp.]